MYRVLIADDEITSVRYLRAIIEAHAPQFEIVAEAENGLDALSKLKEFSPDLLITDIRMPGMDGVELALKARQHDAELLIVIVSGYSEFAYAKGAIAAGVEDYLLKPLNIKSTTALMQKLCEKLDSAYTLRRQNILARLLAGEQVRRDWLNRLFPVTPGQIILLRRGNLPARQSLASQPNAPKPSVPSDFPFLIIQGRDAQEILAIQILHLNASELRLSMDVLEAEFAQGLNTTAIIGALDDMFDMKTYVQLLRQTLDQHLVIGLNKRVFAENTTPPQQPSLEPEALLRVRHCLAARDDALLKRTLFDWAVEWERNRATQRWVEESIDQIAECALSAVPSLKGHRMRVKEELAEVFQVARTLGDVASGAWDILFAPATREHQPSQLLIGEIQTYIQENCAQPLNTQSVSAAFGISQTYLSRLFRRFTQTTFVEYLTETRIALACRLIERHGEMKLKDVARLTGYEDSSYFTKVFQKYMGIAPSQYAQTTREE